MIRDIYGAELTPGDEIVFVTSGYGHSVRLSKGIFNGMNPGGNFRVTRIMQGGQEYKTTLQNNLVIRTTPPKPAWQWLGTRETSSYRKSV